MLAIHALLATQIDAPAGHVIDCDPPGQPGPALQRCSLMQALPSSAAAAGKEVVGPARSSGQSDSIPNQNPSYRDLPQPKEKIALIRFPTAIAV